MRTGGTTKQQSGVPIPTPAARLRVVPASVVFARPPHIVVTTQVVFASCPKASAGRLKCSSHNGEPPSQWYHEAMASGCIWVEHRIARVLVSAHHAGNEKFRSTTAERKPHTGEPGGVGSVGIRHGRRFQFPRRSGIAAFGPCRTEHSLQLHGSALESTSDNLAEVTPQAVSQLICLDRPISTPPLTVAPSGPHPHFPIQNGTGGGSDESPVPGSGQPETPH